MLALAWRNLWRRRWRSLLTALAVAAVVFITLLNFGLVGAATNGMYSRLTGSTGHLQVRVAGYRDLREFADLLIRDAEALRTELQEALPEAELVSVLEVPGLLEGEGRSRGVQLTGMQQPSALRDSYAEDHLLEGSLPNAEDVESVAITRRLADALRVGIGDTVYLYAPGTEGFGAAAYTVTGLLDISAGPQVALVSLAAAQEVAAPEAVSHFEIHIPAFQRVSDDDALPPLQARVEEIAPNYSVETWREVNPALAGYLESAGPITTVTSGIFFILAGLLVLNTIYLSIMERVREFGVIMALGAKRNRVMGMVLSESALLCGLGMIIGAAAGLGLIAYLSQGFSFPGELAELYAEAGLPRVLYASINTAEVIATALFAFFTGLLAALIPAYTAGRLEPVEAMRFAG